MCGIWGCVSKHRRHFDYSTFCTLGIANDTRGGDSCGIFIDGHYEYGVGKEAKYFQNFFITNEFLTNLKESSIAFGHCRKASIGKIDETTAQPVVLTNEKGEVEYVLMHNGTIYNYEDLAKKYIPEIDIKGMTDSQVMARIFYYKGYDALSEYIGAAVFAIADYRDKKPKVYLYKGASKKSQYSKEESEERPLYFIIDNNQLIFSSIDTYLFALKPNITVWDLGCNCICEFIGKELKVIKKISRDKATQQKPFVWEIPKKYNNFGFSKENAYIYNDFISLNHRENIYSLRGKKLHGKIILSKYGGVLSNSSKADMSEEVYFWNGVALKNINCYRFITTLKKEVGCKDFDKKFENLIRFLSIDGLYFIDDICYKATSVKNKEPFTGEMRMLTDFSTTEYDKGKLVSTVYDNNNYNNAFITLFTTDWDFNFKTLREECKYLMK